MAMKPLLPNEIYRKIPVTDRFLTTCGVMFDQVRKDGLTTYGEECVGPLIVGERVIVWEDDDPYLFGYSVIEEVTNRGMRAIVRYPENIEMVDRDPV